MARRVLGDRHRILLLAELLARRLKRRSALDRACGRLRDVQLLRRVTPLPVLRDVGEVVEHLGLWCVDLDLLTGHFLSVPFDHVCLDSTSGHQGGAMMRNSCAQCLSVQAVAQTRKLHRSGVCPRIRVVFYRRRESSTGCAEPESTNSVNKQL